MLSKSIAYLPGDGVKNKIKWIELPLEQPVTGTKVLVQVEYGTISHGNEKQRYAHAPVDGHMIGDGIIGRVVEIGADVISLCLGERVFIGHHLVDHVVVDCSECVPLPEHMDWRNALLLPNLVSALEMLKKTGLGLGDFCLVNGLGSLGLTLIALIKQHKGCVVVGVDRNNLRRKVATRLGADLVCFPWEIRKLVELKFGEDQLVDYVFNCFPGDAAPEQNLPRLRQASKHDDGATSIFTFDYDQSAWGQLDKRRVGIKSLSRSSDDSPRARENGKARWPVERLYREAFALPNQPWFFSRALGEILTFPIVHYEGAADLFQHLLYTSGCSIKSALLINAPLSSRRDTNGLTRDQIASLYQNGIAGPFDLQDKSILDDLLKCYNEKGYDFFWSYRNHHQHCSEIRRFCKHPEFLAKAQSVLGNDLFVYLAQILPRQPEAKKPEDVVEYATGWHSDFENIKCRGVQIYMALTDIKIDSGCLHYYPKSGKEHNVASLKAQKIETWEPLLLKAGQYIIMDGYLIHRPTTNQSNDTRLIAIARYSASGSECKYLANETRKHLKDYADQNPCYQVSGKDEYRVNKKYI